MINTIILWLFPILFIFHDLEEILYMEKWMQRNYAHIVSIVPSWLKKIIPDTSYITTKSFAFGAVEELLLIIIVTLFAVWLKRYYLWLGLFIAFSVHLIIHIAQAIIIKRYIPSLITSIICLPICCFIIMNIVPMMQLKLVAIYSVVGFVIMVLNLKFVHGLMKKMYKIVKPLSN